MNEARSAPLPLPPCLRCFLLRRRQHLQRTAAARAKLAAGAEGGDGEEAPVSAVLLDAAATGPPPSIQPSLSRLVEGLDEARELHAGKSI
jgi:hypothetical protein